MTFAKADIECIEINGDGILEIIQNGKIVTAEIHAFAGSGQSRMNSKISSSGMSRQKPSQSRSMNQELPKNTGQAIIP